MSNVKGLGSLINKLNALGGNANNAVKKGVIKGVKLVQGDAKDLCPVDLGDLRNSINEKVETSSAGVKGSVYTNSDHAPYQEFGTGQRGEESPSPPKSDADIAYREDWIGIPAQPFLYPALKNNEDKVRDSIKNELKEAIREVTRR